MNLIKNRKKFIKKENKLRMENDVRLLADLIYLNYEHSKGKTISINHIYKILHDTVNYTKEEEEKEKNHIFIYLSVDYGLELNK